ncbi:MAG TPA: HEAT repeat domain-containing protein [Polyangiaceae bacterium]|nr:HEAT repeat domain-containing protein [Polyangiaceae bacterium]
MPRKLTIALALAAFACGSNPALETALHGDLASLKRQIRAERADGDLDRDAVEELAAAVAGREIRSARGELAEVRVSRVRGCAAPLLPVLRVRARRADDAGARAAVLLYESGELDARTLIDRHARAASGAWRAVAARASSTRTHADLRRAFFVDPDERARRAALEAAQEAADPKDVPGLLEAARLDPDPEARSLAIHAAGASGGPRVLVAFDDMWPRANPEIRSAIIHAWAMPKTFRAGGRERLVSTAESASGGDAVAAAAILTRMPGADAALGATVLARAVREGTDAERRLAIERAPFWDSDVRKAVHAAAKDPDLSIRVAALARLTENSASRSAARAQLRHLSKSSNSVALRARVALANAGDEKVGPELIPLLDRPNPDERRIAALSLLKLGDYAHAASALADDDPEVRADVACSVLSPKSSPKRKPRS